MNIFKTDSDLEQRIQQVEKLMDTLGLSVTWNGQFCIWDKRANKTYPFVDTESRDVVQDFPRITDGQRVKHLD